MVKEVRTFNVSLFIFYFITIIYLEFIFKMLVFKSFINAGLIYTLFFSITIALILSLLSHIFNSKINKGITYFITIFITFLFLMQYIFYDLFSTFFSFFSLNLANQAFDFTEIILSTIADNIVGFILFLLPLIFLIFFRKIFLFERKNLKRGILCLSLIIFSYIFSLVIMIPGKEKLYSAYNLYFETHEPNISADKIGVLTTMRLDFQRWIFGFDEKTIVPIVKDKEKAVVTKMKYGYNNLTVDFSKRASSETNSSLKQIDNYLAAESGTEKNEYTGLYKGKNLIFILAEGFNEIAVDKDLTPTLYKLANESFVFKKFYSPVFLSTTGGEFQATTGLIPTQEILNTWKKNNISFPFALGNSFSSVGYSSQAYHNWTYNYYGRDKTMPALGFSNYTACHNGLEKLMNCNMWPTSDIDLINVTTGLYTDHAPFMTYYITLSGHAGYNFTGNNMAKKNYNLVKNLPYSESIKAYMATQIEFDRAMQLLIEKLEVAGVLNDTVIAIVGDHYPYTLSADVINEKSTYVKDEIIEVNHSNFILWNPTTETKNITKVASQIDVLPTLLNLFGIEYDSRMIVGKDILSNTEGLAIFSNRSWVTDKGKYYARTTTFVPNDNILVDENYVNNMNINVANKFSISGLLLENNYYKVSLNK